MLVFLVCSCTPKFALTAGGGTSLEKATRNLQPAVAGAAQSRAADKGQLACGWTQIFSACPMYINVKILIEDCERSGGSGSRMDQWTGRGSECVGSQWICQFAGKPNVQIALLAAIARYWRFFCLSGSLGFCLNRVHSSF